MTGRVVIFYFLAFLIGGAGLFGASRNVDASVRRDRWIKFVTYFCIVQIVLVSAYLGPMVLGGLVLLILLIGAFELYRAIVSAARGRWLTRAGIGAGYLLLGIALLRFVSVSTREMSIFVYLVVVTFDGFSQVAGNLFGRRALAPTISPSKTFEGTLGGFALAAVMAILLRPLVHWSAAQSLVACFWIVAAGLSGDLLASWVKRTSGVKDFGRILPGHGGVLDRFDSFLLAGPAALLFLHQSKFLRATPACG
jgi:phosphatidate cytidylyltransferase